MDTHELAWAGGFFDGEGHVRAQAIRGRTRTEIVIAMPQADPRVLERFRAAVGLGRIHGPYRLRNPRWSPRYSYALSGFENVQAAIAMIWKWLSPVKREQARTALARDRAAVRERAHGKPFCNKGHRDGWETQVIKGGKTRRRCRICAVDAKRLWGKGRYTGPDADVHRAYGREATRRSRARYKLARAMLTA